MRAVDPFSLLFDDPFLAVFGPSTWLGAPTRGTTTAMSAPGERRLAMPAMPSLKIDVKESPTAYEIHADCPGLTKVRSKNVSPPCGWVVRRDGAIAM